MHLISCLFCISVIKISQSILDTSNLTICMTNTGFLQQPNKQVVGKKIHTRVMFVFIIIFNSLLNFDVIGG